MIHRFYKGLACAGVLFLIVALSGCGGGGTSSGGSSRTSVYFTDAPISGYSQVLVTVLSARLRNSSSGASAVIGDFTSTGGMSFDLTDLAGVLRLVNIVDVPVGTYDRVEILLANSVSLRDSAGNVFTAKLAPTGDTYLLVINVNLTVSSSPTGLLILDFDLSQFNFDPVSGIVQAVVIPDDSGNDHSTYGRLDEVEGTITSVDQVNSRLTLDLEHSSLNLTVLLDANTICTGGPGPVQGPSCFSLLTPGTHISVKGVLNSATGSLLAALIKSSHSVPGSPSLLDKVEGIVSSVDAGNGTFTVFIREAEGFVPVLNPDGTITVRVDNATLWDNIAGINNLLPQMGVEVLGSFNAASAELNAVKVEAKVAGDDDPTPPGPPPGNCTTVPQKTLLDYGATMVPTFEVEHITLSSVSTGADITVATSNGQTYFLAFETKLEREPSTHICVENLSTFIGSEIEIKYVLGSAGRKVALKLEVK